ncbi:MAG: 1-acyl-sn-glycerol-3-phosphate acyltransferase [Cyclobacteriaceae bacterium]|nr:1-acyl-sn-glycerol-3-phosphate acyltransferase [Cyclobacteriaceae bacterium]
MIYWVVRKIVKLALFIFFRKIVVTGAENIPEKGPLIIVANHPNTLMDPLLVASITKQRVGFLGNASIFINKILIAIFRYFHVIPVFRKKDVKPGEKPDNKESFIKCHEYLAEGNTLLIFPEGSSYYELKLREIKTGTARIALSFEELNNFEGNLKIVPVALDYSDSLQFRSMISITVNPPISVKAYKESYLHNEYECVKELSEDIRKEFAKNVPQTSGKEQETFLIHAHRFYTTYYAPDSDLFHNPKRSLELRKDLSKVLHHIQKHNNSLYQDTQTNVNTFFSRLKFEGLTIGFFTDQFLKKNKVLVTLGYFLTFIFLLPVYLFGLLANFLPYIIPSKVFELLNIDIEYKTSVALGTGLITFPVFYTFEIWMFREYVSNEMWHTLLLLLVLPLSGYLVMFYWTELKRFARVLHFYFVMKHEKKSEMLALRDVILDRMEQARKSLG